MYDRFKLGLVAVLFLFALAFGGAAVADDKKMDCGYCAAVKQMCSMMKCDMCKDGKQCEHCADMSKKVQAAAMCKGCAEAHKDGAMTPVAACADCAAKMPKEKADCELCMHKKMVADHLYCCGKCEAAKMESCPSCQSMRKAVMAVKCEKCEAKKKS